MIIRKTVAFAGVVLGCAVVLGTSLLGYNTFAKWGTLTVPIYVNPANSDVSLSAAIAGVQGAMAVWNTQSGTPFRYTYAGQVSQTTTGNDGKNVVLFRNSTNGGAIATTYSWWSLTGTLIDSDVIFWDGHTKFFAGTSGCVSGAYIEDVGAHELGHALGLSHSSVSEATMNSSYGTCSKNQRTLASDDIAGAKKLYGSSSSGSGSTNAAPSVTISGPANGLTLTAGASVTFSGSASDPEQGNLTNNLIWRSNLLGQIGAGGSFSTSLPAGTHTITASVTDTGGLTAQRQITMYSVTAAAATVGTLQASKRVNSAGVPYTKLVWNGLTSATVGVHRNGALRATTTNDRDYADRIDAPGTYIYKICAAGTSTCTNQVSLTY